MTVQGLQNILPLDSNGSNLQKFKMKHGSSLLHSFKIIRACVSFFTGSTQNAPIALPKWALQPKRGQYLRSCEGPVSWKVPLSSSRCHKCPIVLRISTISNMMQCEIG